MGKPSIRDSTWNGWAHFKKQAKRGANCSQEGRNNLIQGCSVLHWAAWGTWMWRTTFTSPMVHRQFELIHRDRGGSTVRPGREEQWGQEADDALLALFTLGRRGMLFTPYKQARIWKLGWGERHTPLIRMESIWLDPLASKCLNVTAPTPKVRPIQLLADKYSQECWQSVSKEKPTSWVPLNTFMEEVRGQEGKLGSKRGAESSDSSTRMLIAVSGQACGLSCPFWIWLAMPLGRLFASACLC